MPHLRKHGLYRERRELRREKKQSETLEPRTAPRRHSLTHPSDTEARGLLGPVVSVFQLLKLDLSSV